MATKDNPMNGLVTTGQKFEGSNDPGSEVVKVILEASKIFYDNKPETVKFETGIEESEILSLNYINCLTYKLRSNYNFYTDYYEEITKNNNQIFESALPSLYLVGDEANRQLAYKSIITLSGNLDIDPSDGSSEYEYFDEFAKLYQRRINNLPQPDTLFTPLAELQNKIYYTKQGVRRLEQINQNRYLLPFSANINFKTNELSEITSILDATDYTDVFCRTVIQSLNTAQTIDLIILLDNLTVENQVLTVQQQYLLESVMGQTFDSIEAFIDFLKAQFTNEQSNILSLGDIISPQVNSLNNTNDTLNIALRQNRSSSLSATIRLMIFLKKLRQLAITKKQTIEQFLSRLPLLKQESVLRAAPIYSETIIYELSKYFEGVKLQSFYMPNLIDQTDINLFDAQVKFGKIYNYVLDGIQIAFGQKLNLNMKDWIGFEVTEQQKEDLLQTLDEGLKSIGESFDFLNRLRTDPNVAIRSPQIYRFCLEILLKWGEKNNIKCFIQYPILFKKQIFSDLINVYDNPPPPPEVEVDGMIGVDNKILIRVNSSISEFKAKPVIIQTEDTDIYRKNVLAQKLESLDSEMMFDGDDRTSHFQIFRIEHHPTQYSDFKDNFVTASTTTQIDLGINTGDCQSIKANHSSYLDSIKSNQKYYYVFRSVDIHGNISNPSPIYRIDMINQDGTIYPIIEIVELLKKDNTKNTKDVKRFLHITPNTMQTLINEEESGFFTAEGDIKEAANLVIGSIVLGVSEQKLWNKNYRLKIRSKSTGKTVEVDFKFIYNILANDTICR